MVERQELSWLLRQEYGLDGKLHLLHSVDGTDGKQILVMYRLDIPHGHSWIIQAYHETFAQQPIFPWITDNSLLRWLEHRAALLSFLEQQKYPAPRLRLTQNQKMLCCHNGWFLSVSSFIDGIAEDMSIETLSSAATYLGSLHQLPLPSNISWSWWNPSLMARAQEPLDHVLSNREDLKDLLHTCSHLLQSVLQYVGPLSLVHGDCWLPNLLRTKENVAFIDWEFAGKGYAVLDLGAFLLKGQYLPGGILPQKMIPQRVQAIVEGYRQRRQLSEEEIALLPDAIRFTMAWRGILACARFSSNIRTSGIDALFSRVQQGLQLANDIIPIALRALQY
ncbi:phosphotransferase family enzyme [Thermosporothrix hazakensis]|uniref:Phosphotransferase family enzyme n=1 Tax=Thermosporothrix hazakensis TaxID=644383 RepID=A0A326TXM8_THEHA|nr:phosphotransferase [Thermosporothrix hazakensis]PZW21120.1 phosphotransferase family enzyme [Thermosporothrix hazakensis]